MRVRIFKPTKSAMQAGRAKTGEWTIEPELISARTPEPLMGWASAEDTLKELKYRLQFKDKDEAIAFAKKQGWDYTVIEPRIRQIEPRNYLDNFRWVRPQDQKAAD